MSGFCAITRSTMTMHSVWKLQVTQAGSEIEARVPRIRADASAIFGSSGVIRVLSRLRLVCGTGVGTSADAARRSGCAALDSFSAGDGSLAEERAGFFQFVDNAARRG